MDDATPKQTGQGGRKGRSGPPFRPTEKQRQTVAVLASVGMSHDHIRKVILNPSKANAPISINTLKKFFGQELQDGANECIHHVHRTLFMAATDTDPQVRSSMVNAARYYLACRAGWKETVVQQMVGKDGGPIESTTNVTNLTREEVTAAVRDAMQQV